MVAQIECDFDWVSDQDIEMAVTPLPSALLPLTWLRRPLGGCIWGKPSGGGVGAYCGNMHGILMLFMMISPMLLRLS